MSLIDFETKGFQKVPKGLRKTKTFLKSSPECPPTPESIKRHLLSLGENRIKNFIRKPNKKFAEYILSLPEDTNNYRWGFLRQIWITHYIDEISFYDWVLREVEEAKKILGIE